MFCWGQSARTRQRSSTLARFSHCLLGGCTRKRPSPSEGTVFLCEWCSRWNLCVPKYIRGFQRCLCFVVQLEYLLPLLLPNPPAPESLFRCKGSLRELLYPELQRNLAYNRYNTTRIHLQVEDVGMLEGCFAVLGLEFLKRLFLQEIFQPVQCMDTARSIAGVLVSLCLFLFG